MWGTWHLVLMLQRDEPTCHRWPWGGDSYLLYIALHQPSMTFSFVKFLDMLFQPVLLQEQLYKRPLNYIESLTLSPGMKEGQGRWFLAVPLGMGSRRERTRIWVSWPLKSPGFFLGGLHYPLWFGDVVRKNLGFLLTPKSGKPIGFLVGNGKRGTPHLSIIY